MNEQTATSLSADPRLQQLASDACITHSKAMNTAIRMVMADPALAANFPDLIAISDYNHKDGVDSHEFAASLVARAKTPAASITEIQTSGAAIYREYEAQWRSEHPSTTHPRHRAKPTRGH